MNRFLTKRTKRTKSENYSFVYKSTLAFIFAETGEIYIWFKLYFYLK